MELTLDLAPPLPVARLLQVVLYHDQISRNIWRSPDEGRTWKHLDTVPEGSSYVVVEHPFDTSVVSVTPLSGRTPVTPPLGADTHPGTDHTHPPAQAFILSSERTHYRTMNRGETWQSFETPLAPSLSSTTLSFNARRPEWILFAGQKCESIGGWQGKVCHDEVRERVPLISPCLDSQPESGP